MFTKLITSRSSDSEILEDATLTVCYIFNSSLIDSGPHGINGTGTNVQYAANGRVNTSLDLTVNPSFARVTGLVYLGTSGHPYSLAIWIRPISVSGGTIAHVSTSSGTGSWSFPMLGLTSGGNLVAQSCGPSGSQSISGPSVTVNVWTHIVMTHSSSNGLRLWVNGVQVSSSGSGFVWTAASTPAMLTLGTSITSAGSCASTTISTGQYMGSMDEFRLFSRELVAADISTLANP